MATKKAAAKPKKLKPTADPSRPNGLRIVALAPKPPQPRITEDTALTVTAYWACLRFISEALATLPLHVYRARPNGKGVDIDNANDINWLLDQQANPETPAYNWREIMVAHAAGWGNGYSEIERYGSGKPAWLWQITPDRVCVVRSRETGQLYYDIWNSTGPNTVLYPEDVVHLRGLGFDGLVGYSVVQYMSRSLRAAMASQESASTFFENDATPGGVLEHPMRLSATAASNLRETWKARHGGSRNRREVAILEEGMKYHETGVPPKDAQTIEMLNITVTDIARWFRVPPHKVGDLGRATLSNIENEELNAVIDCLMPWARRFEQELNIKLFGRTNRGTSTCKHDFKGRLRGDTAAQTNHITQMIGWGVYSPNDALEYLDRNPIGPDGDKRFVPLNYQLLEDAGEVEQPGEPPDASPNQPDPIPVPADTPNPDGKNMPKMGAKIDAWRAMLERVCLRIAAREAAEIVKANNAKAIETFIGGHHRYLADELKPVAAVIAGAIAEPETPFKVLRDFRISRIASIELALRRVPLEWQPDPKGDATSILTLICQGDHHNGN